MGKCIRTNHLKSLTKHLIHGCYPVTSNKHTHTQAQVQEAEPKPRIYKPLFEAIAILEFSPVDRVDLLLIKGQKVTIVDDSGEFWWRARNAEG